jgi:cytochrome P450
MPNITISLDEDLLKAGRRYARKHRTSLNALLRALLEQRIKPHSEARLDDCFSLMDQAKANSRRKRWEREDLYDV